MLGRTNTGGGGGGGLNFKIVGGTAAPNSPKENMIWINTNENITGYIFSATEPEEYAEGMVWISIGTSSPAGFNALKKNSIMVYPMSAKQYISGAWVDVTAKSYLNGKWVDWWNGELYEAGNLFVDVTGGWTSDESSNAPVITYNATTMEISAAQSGYNKKVRTVKKIDMSQWTKLVFDGTHPDASSYNTMGLLDDKKTEVANVVLRDSHELDVSAFNGMYYVFFQVRDISRKTVVSKLTLK